MRCWSVILLLLAISSVPLLSQMSTATKQASPVVVELFTSEGCSSCPPADALLAEMERLGQVEGTPVIPLGIHVDYWNGPNWTDRFSSPEASLRQEHYARRLQLPSPYTPQMVVDGHINVIGNDRASVFGVILAASRGPKPVWVSLQARPGAIEVNVEGAPSVAQVMLAVTETNLSTFVRGGENGGRTLHHAAVVRSLNLIGTTDDGQFSAIVPLTLSPDWKPADVRAVVFVQQSDGRIIGAASTSTEGR